MANLENTIYTGISEDTVRGVRDRVYKDLNAITEGHADAALKMAEEYNELSHILEEFEERRKLLEEKEEKVKTFEEMLAEEGANLEKKETEAR